MIDKELEVFEVLTACYPDKFKDESEDTWNDVFEFVDSNLGGFENFTEFLERLVEVCGTVIDSPLTGKRYKALSNLSEPFAYMLVKRIIEDSPKRCSHDQREKGSLGL